MNVVHGDCLTVMAGMEPESVDAVVTDPPYGLEFMGKEWDKLDGGLPQENVWKGRRGKGGSGFADKPSVAFKGTVRGPSFGGGQHGFKRCKKCGKRAFSGSPCQCPEPTWVIEYNAGPPSSAVRMGRWHQRWAEAAYRVAKPSAYLLAFGGTRTVHRLTVALEDAGWIIRDMLVWAYASGFPKSKASLKPAWEPIVMARKPGPLRMLAIDSCRLPIADDEANVRTTPTMGPPGMFGVSGHNGQNLTGRWPANLLLTDPIFDGDVDGVVGGGGDRSQTATYRNDSPINGYHGIGTREAGTTVGYGDEGTYSRFFLVPKASRSDREPILTPDWFEGTGRVSTHPTVKPTELMRHLVRLVTPVGGVVLDPFGGSGTTAVACELEGFQWVLVEKEAEYVRIAEARLNGTQRGLGLSV